MRRLRYFLVGFKNAFTNDINDVKNDYPIKQLWRKSAIIENKFKAINEKTRENMKREY